MKERLAVLAGLGVHGRRFAVVGIAATLTHVLVAILLIDGFGISVSAIANALAVLAGSAVSYLGNCFWTFGAGGRHLTRITRFSVAYLLVFSMNALVMFGAADLAGISYLVPLAFMVVLTPAATFVLNRFWVFV